MSTPAPAPAPELNDSNLDTVLRSLAARHSALLEQVSECERALAAMLRIQRKGEPLANPVDGDTGAAMTDARRAAVWGGCLPVADRVVGTSILGGGPEEPPDEGDGGGGGPSGQG